MVKIKISPYQKSFWQEAISAFDLSFFMNIFRAVMKIFFMNTRIKYGYDQSRFSKADLLKNKLARIPVDPAGDCCYLDSI